MSIQLVQVRPALASPLARRVLASPQRVHAVVAATFSASTDEGRPLWRVEKDTILMQGPGPVDIDRLAEKLPGNIRTVPLDPFIASITNGATYRFSLNANASKRTRKGAKPGSIIPHCGATNAEAWLRERQDDWGVDFANVLVTGGTAAGEFDRFTGGIRRHVTVIPTGFTGLLTVTDADLLRHAMRFGIGRGKAYGCGLLSLQPLS